MKFDAFHGLAILNGGTGLFSAIMGLKKVARMKSKPGAGSDLTALNTANPWLYVVFGFLTALLAVPNWYHQPIGTYLTILMIVGSLYNAWFGAGRKDFRWWTLNAYALVGTGLVIWSFSGK